MRAPAERAPIVYFTGAGWDEVVGTDRRLVESLSKTVPVIWIETRGALAPAAPRVSSPAPGVTRLVITHPPAAHRWPIRSAVNWAVVHAVRHHLRRVDHQPRAVVASTTAPFLDLCSDLAGVKVYYATDDFVAAADMWSVSPGYLSRSQERNLSAADLVLTVSRSLATHLERAGRRPEWLPNGTDLGRPFGQVVVPAGGVTLSAPIAGVVGQFNRRLDLEVLESVAAEGIRLLLVGPDSFTTAEEKNRFDRLTRRPNVLWTGAVAHDAVPSYLRHLDVGLTPYADSQFNRHSHPLKTLEYLAAGVPVVTTEVAGFDGTDPRFVKVASNSGEFVSLVKSLLAARPDSHEVRRSVESEGWDDRAIRLLELISQLE